MRFNISFDMYKDTGDENGFYVVGGKIGDREVGGYLASCHATSDASAKKKLRGKVIEKLIEGLLILENDRRAFICCNDGTILLVEYRMGWNITTVGGGRSHSGVYNPATKTFGETFEAAKVYANQCFGGVGKVQY